MPLTTRCRHCGRLFPVYATELKANRARVPCPQCGKRFDAVAGLIDEHVPAIDESTRRRHPAHRTTATTLPTTALGMTREVPPMRRRGRGWTWLGALTAVLLILGLAAQIAWWWRGDWLRHPWVPAALAEICATLGCEVPLPRLPGTIETVDSALTMDPSRPQALRLRLGLISRTEVPQRAPVLQLELYDTAGALVAARRFEPADYLGAGIGDTRATLPPQQVVQATLDIALAGANNGTKPTGFRVRLL